MKKYSSKNWQVDLPDGWQVEEDETISLYDPGSSGVLTFSAVREDEDISDDYLEDLLDEHIEADAELYDVEFNMFTGVSCCYADEQDYWCEWYLRSGPVLLFVTYNCPLEDEGTEEDVVESILESLSLPGYKVIH